jgi:hypothetical protein
VNRDGLEVLEFTSLKRAEALSAPSTPRTPDYRLLVDANNGFSLVRYEHYDANGTKLRYSIDYVYTSIDGVSVPATISKTYVGGPSESHSTAVLEMRNIRLNEPVGDQKFHLEFAPGTTVTDNIANVDYVVPEPTAANDERGTARIPEALGKELRERPRELSHEIKEPARDLDAYVEDVTSQLEQLPHLNAHRSRWKVLVGAVLMVCVGLFLGVVVARVFSGGRES